MNKKFLNGFKIAFVAVLLAVIIINYDFLSNLDIRELISSADSVAFAALIVIGVYFIAEHYYIVRAEKKRIRQAFSKYIAPQVVEEIAQDGKYEIRLGGENRDVAVLFVDIRGFTTMSEILEPEKVVEILNS